MKAALEDEHSEFVRIRAIESVWLSKSSRRGYRHCGSIWGGWWVNVLVASVWASKAMAAAKSPPVSGSPPMLGSRANAVFVVAEGLSAVGGLA